MYDILEHIKIEFISKAESVLAEKTVDMNEYY